MNAKNDEAKDDAALQDQALQSVNQNENPAQS